jgi:hypothetical protein
LIGNDGLGTNLVSLLASCGRLNNYIGFILERGNASTLQMAINMLYSNILNIKTNNFFNYILSRNDIDNQSLHGIISSKSFEAKEKIALVLHFYSKDTQKFALPLNNLVSTISSDENAKKEFLILAEKDEYKELVKEYFIKNEHQIPFFANFRDNFIIKLDSNKPEIKTPSVVIKENGLYLSDDGSFIIDKDGLKYTVKLYSRSVFGPMFPVKSGVMVNGTFIDIEEFKKNHEI